MAISSSKPASTLPSIYPHLPARDDRMGSIDTIPEIKSDIVIGKHEIPKPPVADDFMYDFEYNHPLPTTDLLGIEIPANCNAQVEAEGIVERISNAMGKGDVEAFTDLFLDYGESLYPMDLFSAPPKSEYVMCSDLF